MRAELTAALMDGPGIVVLPRVVPVPVPVPVAERATTVFEAMIAGQKSIGTASGDHFATPRANDRVRGALGKLAVRDPETFADHYAADVIALVSETWLGPGYQVTSQVNVVNPGGAAQSPHRGYHLGFMDAGWAAAYPAHVHALSPALTLQGAVAHVDMPVETSPTLYLPHCQKHPGGYLAFHDLQVAANVRDRCVQLPLRAGDAVFLDPALMHGAGTNRAPDVCRMANLLQVSSAFGRAMETVDHAAMVVALHPVLTARRAAGTDAAVLRRVVTASAEGHAFPTDLDRDAPVDGMAPPTQADLAWRALEEAWDAAWLAEAPAAQQARRSTGTAA